MNPDIEQLRHELEWREKYWTSNDDRKWEQEERYRDILRDRIRKLEME